MDAEAVFEEKAFGSGFLATIGEGYHHFYYYCCFVLLPDSGTPGLGGGTLSSRRRYWAGLFYSTRLRNASERTNGEEGGFWTLRPDETNGSILRFALAFLTNSLLFPTLLLRSSVLFSSSRLHPSCWERAKAKRHRPWGEKFRTLRGCVRVFSSLDFGFSLLLGYGGHGVFTGRLPDYVQRI